ncbi:hypothetical protein [Tenggerimyces flavus]|uniref:Uncharacterized protein n=1 Tax=Tenggerimyces flavus TaxID=1708749 RepID=A0ABV7YBN6_9ACTN|nr:hypothetical protein [Tenggerimyces flavus]MBM7791325.1 hypothetical protein [Tenggerimyces flavus]
MTDRDPLAYLLDDDPIPDDVRADPRFAEAEADVEAIKRGLHLVAAATPKPPKAQRGRWNGNVILAVAACTLAAVTFGGLVAAPSFLGGTDQNTAGSEGGQSAGSGGEPPRAAPNPSDRRPLGGGMDLTEEGLVSCATLIVDGVITDVQPGPTSDTNKLTVNITRVYKPASADSQLTATVYKHEGQRIGATAFVIVSRFANEPVAVFVGFDRDSALQRFDKALAQKQLPPCPGPG